MATLISKNYVVELAQHVGGPMQRGANVSSLVDI